VVAVFAVVQPEALLVERQVARVLRLPPVHLVPQVLFLPATGHVPS
jgi:hypothetical protein